jgi:hypothetical protein
VIVVGQSMGLFIYVRNLMLVGKARRRRQSAVGAPAVQGLGSRNHLTSL